MYVCPHRLTVFKPTVYVYTVHATKEYHAYTYVNNKVKQRNYCVFDPEQDSWYWLREDPCSMEHLVSRGGIHEAKDAHEKSMLKISL